MRLRNYSRNCDYRQRKNCMRAACGIVIGGNCLMGTRSRRRLEHLATKLKTIRTYLGMSQGILAKGLGLPGNMARERISEFENGAREPDLPTLRAYADLAGVSLDVLVNDDLPLPKKLPG